MPCQRTPPLHSTSSHSLCCPGPVALFVLVRGIGWSTAPGIFHFPFIMPSRKHNLLLRAAADESGVVLNCAPIPSVRPYTLAWYSGDAQSIVQMVITRTAHSHKRCCCHMVSFEYYIKLPRLYSVHPYIAPSTEEQSTTSRRRGALQEERTELNLC